jgi:hypothetical protein
MTSSLSFANDYSFKLYFGLSKPDGGAVSIEEWDNFQSNIIGKYFDGFNVTDSIGFYKGKSETSKIVTIISDISDVSKVYELAKEYDRMYQQESVLLVQKEIDDFRFISDDE